MLTRGPLALFVTVLDTACRPSALPPRPAARTRSTCTRSARRHAARTVPTGRTSAGSPATASADTARRATARRRAVIHPRRSFGGGALALTIIIITIGARKLRHHASDTAYFEAPWFLRIDRSLPLDLVRANITGLGETSPNPLAGSLGTRGACCRKGDKNDPPECARASFAYSGYHECVLPRVMGNSLGC